MTSAAFATASRGARPTTRVLLIEDSGDYACLVREMLRDAWPGRLQLLHYERLSTVGSQLRSAEPDCVLLDLSLSDAHGLEALARVQSLAPNVPVVVLTSLDDELLALEAVQEGAQDYLVKGRSDGSLIARAIRYAIERKHAELELSHQAMHDGLTGLPNRALFLDRLEQAFVHAQRHPSPVAVLFLDVDQFKLINDSLGHDTGDKLLVELAARLASLVSPSDTVARFGGDEFTILCDRLESEYDAIAIANRVADEIRRPFDLDDQELFVTGSVGIAYAHDPTTDPRTLVRNADAAMYRAKERGGARYEVYDDVMRARAVRRLEMQTGLHRALARDELRLHYQPQVEIATEAVVGVEALLRWEHPSRGLLVAGEFIALAEDTGLIDDIGDWVLGEACRQQSRWEDALGDRAPTMAVNLSPRELIGGDMPGRLATTLGETGSNPARLCIELTERGVMEDADHAAATLAGLKRLGVRLAIDDFGTGQAALGYLDRFPIDLLKIDRSFVENLGPEWPSKRLVAAAISMAATLGLETVAEGVEREEQATELVGLGCNLGQGFRFAPALPPAELEELVSARRSR